MTQSTRRRTPHHLGRLTASPLLMAILLGVSTAHAAQSAEPAVDPGLLELVASSHQANRERLLTWSGKARVTTSVPVVATPTPGHDAAAAVKMLDSNHLVEFACDRKSGSLWWRWDGRSGGPSRRQEDAAPNGERPDIPFRRNGLLRGSDFYHTQDLMEKGTHLFSVSSPHILKRRAVSPDFDPMFWLTCDGQDVPGRFRYYRTHAEQGHDLPGVSVVRNGDLVTLEIRRDAYVNRYVVNMAQGGLLVEYDAQSPRVKARWQYSNGEVSGVWLPKEITYEIGWDSLARSQSVKVEWLESRVNEPLAEGEFSLVKLGARRGDSVVDMRSKSSHILSGTEYSAPAGETIGDEKRSDASPDPGENPGRSQQ